MFSGGYRRFGKAGADWFYNTHPSSEFQYKTQKFLAGAFPSYGNWMRSRAQDEWVDNQLGVLGLSWSDIRSPWIAGLSGGNAAQALGSAMTSVSDNISELYGGRPKRDKRREALMEKYYRADFRR